MPQPTIVSTHLTDYACPVPYREGVFIPDRSLLHRLGLGLSNDNELRDIHGVHFAHIRAEEIADSVIDDTGLLALEEDVAGVVDGDGWHAVECDVELWQEKCYALTETEVEPFAAHVDGVDFEGVDGGCEGLVDA